MHVHQDDSVLRRIIHGRIDDIVRCDGDAVTHRSPVTGIHGPQNKISHAFFTGDGSCSRIIGAVGGLTIDGYFPVTL